MERLEKSSMAFFMGLSLISSQKASGRACEGLRLTRTTTGFSRTSAAEVEASPAASAADAMAGEPGNN